MASTTLPTPLPITLARQFKPIPHEYTERDTSLYALAVGAGETSCSSSPSSSSSDSPSSELAFFYEGTPGFAPLPTFPCTLPYFGVTAAVPFEEIVPNFSPVSFFWKFFIRSFFFSIKRHSFSFFQKRTSRFDREKKLSSFSSHLPSPSNLSRTLQTKKKNVKKMGVLHGEQFVYVPRPLPPHAEVETEPRVVSVSDKGKAAVVVLSATTRMKGSSSSGGACGGNDGSKKKKKRLLCYQELTVYVRGSGGFGDGGGGGRGGGKETSSSRSPRRPAAATAANDPPSRAPDDVFEQRLPLNAAALYRLTGDENQLHVDPEFAAMAGYE